MYLTGRWVLLWEEVGAEQKPGEQRRTTECCEKLITSCIKACSSTDVGGAMQVSTAWETPLSTLVSPELLILHLRQGPPNDGDRVKNLTPPTQDRGLEPGGCRS